MRIAFFGASVTAQSGEGSYVQALQKMLPHTEILQFGFGACHLDDAGFYKLDAVLAAKPDRVVLEWNTTGLDFFNPQKLDAIVHRVLGSGALVAFLILPRRDSIGSQTRPAEVQIREICRRHDIPLLDLRSGFEPDGLLRDMVHTTPDGARYYAACVASWATGQFGAPSGFSVAAPAILCREVLLETEVTLHQGLRLGFSCMQSPLEELVVAVTVGPNLVDLEVEVEGSVRRLSFVDRWCYYEREMFYVLWRRQDAPGSDRLEIRLRAFTDLPDYSMLERPAVVPPASPALRIHAFHMAGLNLERIDAVDTLNEFHAIYPIVSRPQVV